MPTSENAAKEFWHYYGPPARVVIISRMEAMIAALNAENQARFVTSFAEPMARSKKVASWRDLPFDTLAGLHDLLARTEPDMLETRNA